MTASSEHVTTLQDIDAHEIVKSIIDFDKTITLRTLDLVPEGQRYFVYVLWTLSVMGAIAGSFLLLNSYPTYAFVIYILTFVCIIISVIVQSKPTQTTPENLVKLVQQPVSGPAWARVVLKMPIEKAKLDDSQLRIRTLRTQAVNFINMERKRLGRSDLESEKVRINVFLPDTKRVADGEVCGLFIPSQMHDNMSSFEDRNIKFRPHEGLTGRTFTLGEAGGAIAELDAQNNLHWSRINVFPQRPYNDEWVGLELSDQQKSLIENRLRWIVSFPLLFKKELSDKPFGVLNIDGLDDSMTEHELCSLANNMEPNINVFAGELAQLPQVRIAIRVEDVPIQ